jgi:O-antigen biosynthesis protein
MSELVTLPTDSVMVRKPIELPLRRATQARLRVDGRRLRAGAARFRVQGVTYGPFAPSDDGVQFPSASEVCTDFAQMESAGINSIRVYHVPPEWLLDVADEAAIKVLIDVPWRKHLCFLESSEARREARMSVRQAAERGRSHPCVLAYSIANEIPPDVVRWHGRRRVERFLSELCDVARQTDPESLLTYASFPPTEYLDTPDVDFATFNVYLHDREAFRRYLFRLQNLIGDKPLLIGELGMDTLRHGEVAQADFLSGHLAETQLMGLAGAFVFSWTDDWHTGGHRIEDWAFGVTQADRSPKASFLALREQNQRTAAETMSADCGRAARVSVVVCSYNGGRTLHECLKSLVELDYPDYEVIVVDDGSTDDTPEILARFPEVRIIRQTNQGLSVARNVGAHAATGSIVAYTDSDCFADPDWLTHLVYQLERSKAAAVGGPNLTPEDGWLAGCVAASPGQPTHVLEGDQEAEHIPGCNMAFRREELLAINGFDPIFRKAGDDVDVCWRLQHEGKWITFAPGAFVWHHRRQTPKTYLRQQAGYGEAESLLQSKHPEKFNGRGEGKWRGVLYGSSLHGLRLGEAIIYRGTYATGLFQCIYQPGTSHWAMLPTTLEWHAAALFVALGAVLLPWMLAISVCMVAVSLLLALVQAFQARLVRQHDGIASRLVVAALCYAQPLVRSWARYRTRSLMPAAEEREFSAADRGTIQVPWTGRGTIDYWTEEWRDRTELLGGVVRRLEELRWPKVIDAGWSEWDLEILRHSWTKVQICTVQEEHGGKKRLIRMRYRVRLRGFAAIGALCGLLLIASAGSVQSSWAAAIMLAVPVCAAVLWRRCAMRAAEVLRVIDAAASEMNLIRCVSSTRKQQAGTENA